MRTDHETPTSSFSARHYRKLVWQRIAGPGRLRRVIAFIVLIGFIAAIQLTDIFGFSSVSADKSREIVSRILSPWYKPDEGQSAAVILLRRNGDREWPPSYPQLASELETILRQCPRAVVIDIFFDSRRHQPISFGAFLTRILEARAEAGCGPLAVPLIFADDLDPRQPMLPELIALADGSWSEADYCRYRAELARPSAVQPLPVLAAAPPAPLKQEARKRKPGKDRRAPKAVPAVLATPSAPATPSCPTTDPGGRPRWSQVAMALAAWPSEEEDAGSRYSGLSHAEFYRLIGPKDEERQNGNRASLALAAYFAHCGLVGCGNDRDRQAAMQRWLSEAGVSRREVSSSIGAAFGAPQDIQWQRWSPPDHNRLWTSPGVQCALPDRDRTWGNIKESARLFAVGIVGSSAAARREERVPCYPFVTLDADRHLQVFCDACRGNPDPAEAEKWDALRRGIPSRLRDKVVFVGVGDPASGDLVRSPAHEVLPGVFRHAMAFDNLVAWDTEYRRRPETNIVGNGSFNIGTNAVTELLVIVVVAILAYLVREFAFRRWWKAIHDSLGTGQGTIGHVTLALLLELLLIISVVAVLAAVSIACAILFHVVWGWAVVNWINVAAFSVIPVYLLTDRMERTGGEKPKDESATAITP